MRPRARSNSPSLLDSMITGICLNTLLCLIKEQVWYPSRRGIMMSTKTISGWWSAILERASKPSTAVNTSHPSLVRSVSAVRRMVLLSSITRTLRPVSFGLPLVIMLSMTCVGAGILWLFNISSPRKPRYGVDISSHVRANNGGLVHSFPKRAALPPLTLDWRNEHVVSSASRRGHGPYRSDQAGEGHHPGAVAQRAGPRLGAALRRTERPLASRRGCLGSAGAAQGLGRFVEMVLAGGSGPP